jgi:hypothetical protein
VTIAQMADTSAVLLMALSLSGSPDVRSGIKEEFS